MDKASLKNKDHGFMNILFQVKNKIDLFDKEFQFVREGFIKIEKIHGDIISDLQGLGDAFMLHTSEKDFKKGLNEINIDDYESDEVVPRSPIKNNLKSSKKNNCTVKLNLNNYDDETHLENRNKKTNNEIENIDDFNDLNATVNENKYFKSTIIKNDDFDETYCPWAEEQLKNKIDTEKLLCTVKNKKCVLKDNIQIDTENRKASGADNYDNKNLSFHKNQLPLSTTPRCSNYLDDYDRVPEKKKKGLEYPCKGPVVRKKLERAKLPGWDCKNCEKWYQNLGLSPKELQKRKKSTSRHRSKFNERYETPPGFWNLSFPKSFSSSDED